MNDPETQLRALLDLLQNLTLEPDTDHLLRDGELTLSVTVRERPVRGFGGAAREGVTRQFDLRLTREERPVEVGLHVVPEPDDD